MQTIRTKYLGPTNYRGSRYKATSSSGISISLSTDYRLNSEENHRTAVVELIKKLNWNNRPNGITLHEGCLDESGYIYVIENNPPAIVVLANGEASF